MKPPASFITGLGTESRNPASARLDTMSATQIARLINEEDKRLPAAVERALPQIAEAMERIAEALTRGGRLIYVGCGTSGRIASLDASEIRPSFGTHPEAVQYVIAGGERALGMAAEYNEDSRTLGRRDLARRRPGPKDVVVGIGASGRTPYTVAALELAKERGATVVAVVCNPASEMETIADLTIVTEVGPEVVSGSTRMKAGTAQKLVLNMLSTGAMALLGRVYGNLMVHVQTQNEKLVARGVAILEEAAGVDRDTATRALRQANHDVAVALVMLKASVSVTEARQRLKAAGGHVRRAIEGPKAIPTATTGRKRS